MTDGASVVIANYAHLQAKFNNVYTDARCAGQSIHGWILLPRIRLRVDCTVRYFYLCLRHSLSARPDLHAPTDVRHQHEINYLSDLPVTER